MMGKKLMRVLILCLMFAALLTATAFGKQYQPTDTDYPVPGGAICFNKETGKITGFKGEITDVTIPREIEGVPVTAIASYAFKPNYSMTSVVIPESVTTIESEAFSLCKSLSKVVLPESLTSIGELAFAQSGLTSLMIPGGVKEIGKDLFQNCKYLSAVMVSEGVEEIGGFDGCINLTSVLLPSSLKRIQAEAFYRCESLAKIEIPDGVEEIGDSAFGRCGLTSVRIPSSVRFGKNVFEFCFSLSSVDIADGVTEIPDGMFKYCKTLFKIRIPQSVSRIGDNAFYVSGLGKIVIPSGVTEIGTEAFNACHLLTDVTIPRSVVKLGSGAFQHYDMNLDVYYEGSEAELKAIEGLNTSGLMNRDDDETDGKVYIYYNSPMSQEDDFQPIQNIFQDVPADSYFALPVTWAYAVGVTGGTTPTEFSPHSACNMAQVLTFIWRANGSPSIEHASFYVEISDEEMASDPFLRLPLKGYYATAAKWSYVFDILLPEEFKPDAPCTRAMLVNFLWRINGSSDSYTDAFVPFGSVARDEDKIFYKDIAAEMFSDVSADSPYATAIGWALKKGLTQGTSDTTFSPDEICSRAQVMTILYRAQGKDMLYR